MPGAMWGASRKDGAEDVAVSDGRDVVDMVCIDRFAYGSCSI